MTESSFRRPKIGRIVDFFRPTWGNSFENDDSTKKQAGPGGGSVRLACAKGAMRTQAARTNRTSVPLNSKADENVSAKNQQQTSLLAKAGGLDRRRRPSQQTGVPATMPADCVSGSRQCSNSVDGNRRYSERTSRPDLRKRVPGQSGCQKLAPQQTGMPSRRKPPP